MEFARPIDVPLDADSVDGPEIRHGLDGSFKTALIFNLSHREREEDAIVGRVTFEELDAIRCCRGEDIPFNYEIPINTKAPFPWVFEVDDSQWLAERHAYEMRHYNYPLLNDFVHYVFCFHDEFVEVIAKGIWLEKIDYEKANNVSMTHPLRDLPLELPSETFSVCEIICEVRHNPEPIERILHASQLCSQKLFQYFMTLDGWSDSSYAAMFRTIHGRSSTRLMCGTYNLPYLDLIEADGIATEAAFRPAFCKYVEEVAEQRRMMNRK